MSRIGKKPVAVPKGVTLDLVGNTVAVKGPRRELRRTLHPAMQLSVADGSFTVARPSDEPKHKALHGLSRTLVQNMVDGVTTGFSKTLEIQGVGYKAEVARLLRDNHYIADFKVLDDGGAGVLRLYLKYHNELPVIRELRRVSTPGLRRYVKCRELPRVKNGLGMAIVSTPKGLMTDREARSANLGGELLAVVW